MSSTLRTSRSALDWANQYIDHGLAPIPVPFREKGAKLPEWQNLRVTKANVADYFNGRPQNIGVLLGKPSGNLVDIDLDCPEAVLLAPRFLPVTDRIFGRKSNPRSHWLYRTLDDEQTEQMPDPERDPMTKKQTMLVEFRSTGAQTVFPGSVHMETGENIRFDKDGEMATVDGGELCKDARHLAAASLLARHWPDGSRHLAAMALSGALLNAGWSADETEQFVKAVAEAARDDEDRESEFRTTLERHEADDQHTGLTRLKELLGDRVINKVAEWLELRSSKVETGVIAADVARLNKIHAVVRIEGKVKVLNEEIEHGTGRKKITFSSPFDFKSVYCDETVQTPSGMIPLGSRWWTHPQRRKYMNGIIFDPTAPKGGKGTSGHYNLWHGFAREPVQGDCSLYLRHIREVIASGRDDIYDYVLGWMADAIQNPGVRPGVALALRGKQGTGKTILFDMLGELFGSHYITVANERYVTGNFNAHLEGKILLLADEATFPGDKRGVGTLRGLVTGKTRQLEYKGIDPVTVPNFIRLVLASNEKWVVPAGIEERRFLLLDVSDAYKQDHAYFAALVEQMDNGGYEALMHFLLHYDLSQWNAWDWPDSGALLDQKIRQGSFINWWHTCLKRGWMLEQAGWNDHLDKDRVYGTYQEYALKFGDRRPDPDNDFGKSLVEVAPTRRKIRRRTTANDSGGRSVFYQFPPLDQCRDFHIKRLGGNPEAYDWEDPEEVDPEEIESIPTERDF